MSTDAVWDERAAGTATRGDRSLHWTSAGRGSPTILLEAGIGTDSGEWSLVHDDLAALTRVIAYDRVGYGASGPGEPDAEAAVRDLEAVLADAGVVGPVVLMGHSWGGVLARLYATRHPDVVAAVVLVDATHENVALLRNPLALLLSRAAFAVEERRARRGRMRSHLESGRGPLGKVVVRLPAAVREPLVAALCEPHLWSQARRETATVAATLRSVPAELPNIPVVAVVGTDAAGRAEARLRAQLRAAYEAWLPALAQGRLVEAPRSGHLVPLQDPELLVRVLRELLDELRSN